MSRYENKLVLVFTVIMHVFVILSALFCLALARPQQQRGSSSQDAVVLKYESENDGNGQYKFAYETSDGQTREEQGSLKNAGTENESLSVTGSFSFIAPDGVMYTVRYIADENGFRPEGDHIPKRMPQLGIPPAALGSLIGGGIGK